MKYIKQIKSGLLALTVGSLLSAGAAIADQAIVVNNAIQMPSGVMQPEVNVDVYEQGQQSACASFHIREQQMVISSGANHDCKATIDRLHYQVADGPSGLMSAWFELGLSGDIQIQNKTGLMPQITFSDAPIHGGVVPGTGAVPRGKIVAYVSGPYA